MIGDFYDIPMCRMYMIKTFLHRDTKRNTCYVYITFTVYPLGSPWQPSKLDGYPGHPINEYILFLHTLW